jgi:hypothetical protein
MASRNVPSDRIMSIPTTFQVGAHAVKVAKVSEGRWSVSVDGGPDLGPYPTQSDAWEAGVRAADVLPVAPAR